MPSLRLTLAGLLLAVVAAAPAAAASPTQLPPGITIPKITGLKLVRATYELRTDWRVIADTSRSCAAYVRGDGMQLMKVELKKPVDYALVQIGKTISLSPSNRPPRFTSAVTRLFDWDRKFDECACGPNSEYGPCGPPAPEPRFDCTPRISGAPMIEIRNGPAPRTGDTLMDELLADNTPDTTLSAIATPGKKFDDCAPDGETAGHAMDIHLVDATSWKDAGWARQLAALRPGKRRTLTARTLTGVVQPKGRPGRGSWKRCPAKPRAGTWRCERGAVALTFERR